MEEILITLVRSSRGVVVRAVRLSSVFSHHGYVILVFSLTIERSRGTNKSSLAVNGELLIIRSQSLDAI